MIEEYDGSGSVYYIREPDGEFIARVDNASITYYHFDALGSTRLLTDAMGTVTDTYAYDAWGNVMMHTGTTAQPYQFVGQLGYYTHVQDANLPLLQLGVRFYDPQVGRFGQRDAAEGGLCYYAYVADNPQAHIDPTGLICCSVDLLNKCLCMHEVWTWYKAHSSGKDNWFGNDKVAHCWFSCKMVKYCHFRPVTVMGLGFLKECYDCFDRHNPGTSGFEDVERDDLRADRDGIRIGQQPNSDCLRECKKIWKSGKRRFPPRSNQPHKWPLPDIPWLIIPLVYF